jgi:hypothetical protein
MTIETQARTAELTEDAIYLVTTRVEEDMSYTYNRRDGEHVFSRPMENSFPFLKQIFVEAGNNQLNVDGKKVDISKTGYVVGMTDKSENPEEYERLSKIWGKNIK